MRRPLPLALLLSVAAGTAAISATGCEREKYAPTECTVWTEKGGDVSGTVYMRDTRASFTGGAARSNSAYIDGAGHVMVLQGSKTIDAAVFDGQTIKILYLPDAQFESQGFDNGTIVFASDTYRTEFYYNSLCTAADVAVGATALFTTVFPVGQPASL